jgi:cation diffusion facilitator CzcD-associated flavoprotein CzcO
METVDLVVIGTGEFLSFLHSNPLLHYLIYWHNIFAGWHGLVAAKTYLEVNPEAAVVILEAESTIGGVWAKHRLYHGLKSNNLLGTYEYSDFPMDQATFGVKPGEHIPGEVLQTYFEKYVEHFQFADKIRLNRKVESAEHQTDGSWLLTVAKAEGGSKSLLTHKLIVATGMTSQAFLPTFQGQESFEAPLFHCRDFPKYEKEVLQDGKRATVFGGTKSAWDAAYACASSGLQVDWIIRESGHGPTWMAPPFVTPLKKWLEKLVTTRFLTWFSPCIWGDADGYEGIRKFYHETWIGRKVVDAFWAILADDVIQLNKYDKDPQTKKLKPWIDAFWTASSLSILNYPTDFFDYVRNGTIKVHIADITHLSANAVHLSTDDILQSDLLICATGWKSTPPLKFLPEGIDQQLGLPWSPDSLDQDLVKRADEEILKRFPRLRDQPTANPKYKPLSNNAEAAAPHPFRLARFMVPPLLVKERSIAFLGIETTINTAILAQTQALWATAYFNDKLSIVPTITSTAGNDTTNDADYVADLEWETALHTEFGKWRYPGGFGRRNPDFVFDAIPYVDLLLRDLGLKVHRKNGMIAEMFEPYGPEDYRGLIEEWKSVHG